MRADPRPGAREMGREQGEGEREEMSWRPGVGSQGMRARERSKGRARARERREGRARGRGGGARVRERRGRETKPSLSLLAISAKLMVFNAMKPSMKLSLRLALIV